MSCHGKIACSLNASTLPRHFTYIVEGCLFLSECSAPSTPWLQAQFSLSVPGAAQTPSAWQGVSGRAVFVIPGGVVLWEGSAVLWWYMGCLCPVLPHQLSAGTGALGRLCWLCSQRGSCGS